MNISKLIYKWGLLRTFALSSIVTIVFTTSISGFLLFNFLHTSLLRHDSKVSSQLIQHISSFSNLEEYFSGISRPENLSNLNSFFERVMKTPDVYRVVVYDKSHKILWSDDKQLVGQTFLDNDELDQAFTGEIVFREEVNQKSGSNKDGKVEHDFLPVYVKRFVESYIPIWNKSHSNVIGVIELYKSPLGMYDTLNAGRILVIVFSILSGVTLYGLLFLIVKTAHILIEIQRGRISKANSRVAEINEQYLRRIGSELHDGPAQSISYALLNLECVMLSISNCQPTGEVCSTDEGFVCQPKAQSESVRKIQSVLKDSLQEIRDLSSGLVIPDLSQMSLKEALKKIFRKHELRTGTKVIYDLDSIPEFLDLAKKICLYRFAQEGLNNAFKHGDGLKQCVIASRSVDSFSLSISDSGPGCNYFDLTELNDTEHLGLRGLRDRVEGLGGQFDIIQNTSEVGFKIKSTLPLDY